MRSEKEIMELKIYPKTKSELKSVQDAGWCDGECADLDCQKKHYHVKNCKCQSCYDLESDNF